MTTWAKFWAIDLHVHTPASADVKPENFGSAADIVRAALDAGLDAIAVTDHNTAAWCDQISAAADGSGLVVLPGVEISTTEGHLLAVWEEGTSCTTINEVLVRLGIRGADQGNLEIAATLGFADAAKEVFAADGVAIAAHIDQPKGLLKLPVKAHLKRTLLEECLTAVEITRLTSQQDVEEKIKGARLMAYVQGSDTWDAVSNVHALSGVGARRTWIKASRPDLIGIRHALADPELRVLVGSPPSRAAYNLIERVEITGGFLDGQAITLCPDLNCLLGGTGTGKSLVLESIRFALDQQVDAAAFPAIYKDVASRLEHALHENSVVRVEVFSDGHRYRIDRTFTRLGSKPAVYQQTADDWIEVDAAPRSLVPIAAFSQGEILEYSRQPVGRMSLVDAGLDLSDIDDKIAMLEQRLQENTQNLIGAKRAVGELEEAAASTKDLTEQVRQLSSLFNTDAVKKQASWKKEDARLKKIIDRVSKAELHIITLPGPTAAPEVESNEGIFRKVSDTITKLRMRVTDAESEIKSALDDAQARLKQLQADWNGNFSQFRRKLDEELEKVQPGASLSSLRAHLESLQGKLEEARSAKEELDQQARPALDKTTADREMLLTKLHEERKVRRELRRSRVEELNAKAAGFVKLDIPDRGDYGDFRDALNQLKVGSRVREDVLENIARKVHPLRFARAMWERDVSSLVDISAGIDTGSIARLLTNIDERDLWEVLLNLQLIDRPDVLTVRFRKPDDRTYAPIESLAHGQRCTAILVILLADGATPVLVDQPEDALHAPWIEEYLVDRLRKLRGSRQYIFATRSPGMVVSGDAEQIVTMHATAGKGEVEASGSLERHDLNRLALYHLEGGPIAFSRRTQKLAISTIVDTLPRSAGAAGPRNDARTVIPGS